MVQVMSQEQFNFDFDVAEAFLDVLAPSGTFTFQTFADKNGVDNQTKKNLTRQFHGTFAECRDKLADLNRRGAGVFVTINETDLNRDFPYGFVRRGLS